MVIYTFHNVWKLYCNEIHIIFYNLQLGKISKLTQPIFSNGSKQAAFGERTVQEPVKKVSIRLWKFPGVEETEKEVNIADLVMLCKDDLDIRETHKLAQGLTSHTILTG